MKRANFIKMTVISGIMAVFASSHLSAQAGVGDRAPDFKGTDSRGKTVSLSDYRDKIVVLEWFNVGCPFTRKHYLSSNMQTLQKEYTKKGVVWLSITSSAPGKQGYLTLGNVNDQPLLKDASPTAIILDSDGKIGRLYGAKTTPHMFIIDRSGYIVYNGAIDSIRSTDVKDVPRAENYVKMALDELLEGKTVTVKTTQPYGCSVKYAD